MSTFLKRKIVVAIFGYLITGVVAIPLLLLTAALGFERYLTYSSPSEKTSSLSSSQLAYAYRPFSIQYINPFYLFFFPFNEKERVALSNSTVRLTVDGYRGDGPSARDDRKLAFLIGGSTVFGYYASNNDQTISAWLNREQSTYHFVNAGVPSFNSNQELFRVINDILPESPKLLINLNGENDFSIPFDNYFSHGVVCPAGVPESYHNLHSLVENIRAKKKRIRTYSDQIVHTSYTFFPRASKFFRAQFGFEKSKWHNILIQWSTKKNDNIPHVIKTAASKYIYNMGVVSNLCKHYGCDHVTVFQPMAILHEPDGVHFRSSESEYVEDRRGLAQLFRETVFSGIPKDERFWDFSRVFDRIAETEVFLDEVHVTDLGNRLIAEEILNKLPSKF